MLTRICGFLAVLCAACPAVRGQVTPPAVPPVAVQTLEPYPLPARAEQALCELAGESDVLMLGELHGTQEVPAMAAALLGPLTKLGYGALALEIPADQRGPLADWATGKTKVIPGFFAQPISDGRGNIQALSLIRTALSPPFGWQLICFDWPQEEAEMETAKILKMGRQATSPPFSNDFVAVCMRLDADMARNLTDQRAKFAPRAKVLAICGSFHARTANRFAADMELLIPPDSPMRKFWPSLAAALQSDQPTWTVRSVNVVLLSGASYGVMSVDGGPDKTGVHPIRSNRQLDEAEAHALTDDAWHWELALPRATPATFLAEPVDFEPPPAAAEPDKVLPQHASSPCLSARHWPGFARRRLCRHFFRPRAPGCRR